jgi:hypothetical protein
MLFRSAQKVIHNLIYPIENVTLFEYFNIFLNYTSRALDDGYSSNSNELCDNQRLSKLTNYMELNTNREATRC